MSPVIIGEEHYPGIDVQTDGHILKFIENSVMILWHPAGSCEMGTMNDH